MTMIEKAAKTIEAELKAHAERTSDYFWSGPWGVEGTHRVQFDGYVPVEALVLWAIRVPDEAMENAMAAHNDGQTFSDADAMWRAGIDAILQQEPTLERAVRSANFVVEGSQGKNHNVDVEEIVRDVLETVRVDMNLMLQVGREIGVQPSVVGLCWTRCIDAILGLGVSRETGTSGEGGKINTAPSGRQED